MTLIQQQDNFFYYKTKYNYNGKSSLVWVKSDCKNDKTTVLEAQNYSPQLEDNFVYTADNDNFQTFDKNTSMYLFHNRVCKSYKAGKTEKPLGTEYLKGIDWGYMRNLEGNIKKNWVPPKADKSDRVIVTFRVGKKGELLSYILTKKAKMNLQMKLRLKQLGKQRLLSPCLKNIKENPFQ